MTSRFARVLMLSAAMAVSSFPTFAPAADEPKTEKTTPPTSPTSDRPRLSAADRLKNYRDQFEGLNLQDDQMKKIDGFIETAEVEVKKAGNSEDREARTAAFGAIRKLDEDVQSVLTDTQKAALRTKRQSMMVDRMKAAYVNPELKLTDDQTTKINAIFAAVKTEMASVDTTTGDRREAFQKIFKMMGEAREKANALLTEDQKKLIPAPRFPGRRNGQGNAPNTPPSKN